jgi:hypothetical protein
VQITRAQQISGKTKKVMELPNINGLEFKLSEGVEGAEKRTVTPPTKGDNLSETETANLLKRLPEIKKEDDDQKDFALREKTILPPKTGQVVPVKFPQPEQKSVINPDASKVLEVLRYSPQGDVPLVSDLSITFSQPMVAVTSQEQAAQVVPVQLTPEVKGQWRWLGTKTLIFDAEKRFQMATKYTATVKAGTKSAIGGTLNKDVSWTFSTPPPKMEQMYPSGQTTQRNVLMFASFDQVINPEAVLSKVKVTANGKPLQIRLATPEEVKADTINYYAQSAMPGRWIAFRAVLPNGETKDALPGDSAINVTFEAGMPSAEGPLTTPKAQSFSFRTYGVMKFVRGYCGWQGKTDCSPFDPWYLEFTNPIDAAGFTKNLVKIEPAVEGLTIYPAGNYIYIQGYKPGRKTYKVNIELGAIKDVYAQTSTNAANATFTVGSAPANLYAQGGSFVVLDPTAKPNYSVYSINHTQLKVQIRAVTPENWEQFRQYMRYQYYEEEKRPQLPGKIVFDGTIPVQNKPDELVETRIDISKTLDGGFGHAIVIVNDMTPKKDRYNRNNIIAWVQSTQIGLDAFVDNEELVAFATDLKTGKPLPGTALKIYPNSGSQLSSDTSGENQETTASNGSWWDWLNFWGSSETPETTETVENKETTETTETVGNTETNEPLQGVIQTGQDGTARIELGVYQSDKGQSVLIAKRGKDTAFLPENADYYWQNYGGWYKKSYGETLRWFVFDDRQMYRPKEEVSVKGYIRKVTAGKFSDIVGLGDAAGGLTYSVKDAQGNEIAKGEGNLNAFGAFDLKFKLPDNMNLGYARIDFSTSSGISGYTHSHSFQVQEFRRPEFEVNAKVESEAPFFIGGSANVSIEGKYYAGGALQNAEANWVVTSTPTNYTPPNRGDFTFGKWFPWWRYYETPYGNTTTQTFKGTTGADGKHLLKIEFLRANPARPYSIRAEGSVSDVNRQTWTDSTTLLVHPADLYVGIRTPRNFVNRGDTFNVESITTDLDGKAVAGRDVTIKALLKDWKYNDKTGWSLETIDEQICEIKSGENPVNCKFTAKQGGVYTITATVMDDRERFNESELTMWVSGGKSVPKRNVEMEEANLIPSKKDHAPGDTAEILVQTPFVPAEGVLTLRRNGIVKTERFTMNEPSKVLKINIEERYLPNITAQVDLVGAAERTNDKGEADPKVAKRPAFASGNINLPISLASRKLTVSAEPTAKNLEPGGETTVNLQVKDMNGNAVSNSEVAVVVVDESVLALSGYRIADPVSIFYQQIGAGVSDYHLRKDILLGNIQDIKPQPTPGTVQETVSVDGAADKNVRQTAGAVPKPSSPMTARKAEAKRKDSNERERDTGDQPEPDQQGAIKLRENFNALAVFSPSVKTDSSGKATVNVKLPDNLTRYRITAVAVTGGNKFGTGESNITARQPLMVRPSAPRFLNFGDKFELPVVIQNQTDNPMKVNIAVRATNAELTAGGGRSVDVPANDRLEIRFPSSAVKAGIARFQIGVSSGKWADAAEINLPVWTPATTEAFATYGTTDQNTAIIQPVQTPGDVFSQFGGLEVTTSSTQLQELTDAFIYLSTYPYGCSEQISSRILSIAALRDVLQAFKAKELPSPKELNDSIGKQIEILQGRQNDNGSFGLWRKNDGVDFPYITIHVVHALGRAKAKGYKVPEDMLNRANNYLKNIESHIPKWYSKESRWAIVAYALYVRNFAGDTDLAKAKKLLTEAGGVEKVGVESIGWLYPIFVKAKDTPTLEKIRFFLNNNVTETAGAAHFVTNYSDGEYVLLASNRRADGIILESLLMDQPDNDLIPKIVRGLLMNRKAGRWGNTQENVFILLALDRYFNVYEKVTPDFVAQIWLGNAYAGEQQFKGRSTDFNQLNIPMNYLIEQGGASNLILNKQGAGRIYYRIGMKYAPKNLKLAPADYGFEVTRKYEAVDNPDDVRQEADGTWVIKAGARVRVRLSMVAPTRRYHVALVDPLPAGLEALNPALAVTGSIPRDDGQTGVLEYGDRMVGRGYYYWRGTWYEHQNLRDERAEAFTSLLWQGVWNYSYVARATTPGQFVVPPAKAEEMYAPETFGRTGTDFVRVE